MMFDRTLVSLHINDVVWSQQAGSVPLRFNLLDTEMGEHEFQRPVAVSVESRFSIGERSLFLLAVTGDKTAHFYAVQLLVNTVVRAIAVLDGLRYILLHVLPIALSVHISISRAFGIKYTRMKGKLGRGARVPVKLGGREDGGPLK